MQMLDHGIRRHRPDAALLGGRDDLIVDEPVAVAFVCHHAGPIPARADLVNVGPANQGVTTVLAGDDAWISEVVCADDLTNTLRENRGFMNERLLRGFLGPLQPPRVKPD